MLLIPSNRISGAICWLVSCAVPDSRSLCWSIEDACDIINTYQDVPIKYGSLQCFSTYAYFKLRCVVLSVCFGTFYVWISAYLTQLVWMVYGVQWPPNSVTRRRRPVGCQLDIAMGVWAIVWAETDTQILDGSLWTWTTVSPHGIHNDRPKGPKPARRRPTNQVLGVWTSR